MRIIALMTVRNEEKYLEHCIRHLVSQGVEICLIDNGSTDRTREIASAWLGKGVMRIEEIPFNGLFELEKILKNEERLSAEIQADWFMHHDADEIREAPAGFRNLAEGVADADRQGYNAINFDEFVFVPTGEDEDYESSDYVATMKYYYFFEPAPLRRVNLWKNAGQVIDLVSSGGHSVRFAGRRVYPLPFVMRHYILLSRAHAERKFGVRIYPQQELARKWHLDRARHGKQGVRFPGKQEMKYFTSSDRMDRSAPKLTHLIFPDKPSILRHVIRMARRVKAKLALNA